mgnify:CR=1 FL=1
MDQNWPYVAVGYGLTIGTVGAYTLWLRARLAQARRAAATEEAAVGLAAEVEA